MNWSDFKHRMQDRAKRLKHAIRYVAGTLTPDNAQDMLLELRYVAGWYPIVTLCVEDVMTRATEVYRDTPELREVVEGACQYVEQKYDYSDTAQQATSDAFDRIEEEATSMGVTLVELDVPDELVS